MHLEQTQHKAQVPGRFPALQDSAGSFVVYYGITVERAEAAPPKPTTPARPNSPCSFLDLGVIDLTSLSTITGALTASTPLIPHPSPFQP